MSKKEIFEKESPYAFPINFQTEGYSFVSTGMSLRDYMAGQALVGICSASDVDMSFKEMAEWCYKAADKMMEARDE